MSTTHAPVSSTLYDLVVIGGGINGTGIAADASGRGLSVLLCEQDDLASHTSSASSKLIHGGLRYLEHYEFRLVREALAEREVLLAKAPHIVKPLRFVLPHRPHLRPAWMIRAGMFLYDHLGKREKLPASRRVRFGADSPLKPTITEGFEYSDCWVDDARLVVLNAMAARENGAHVHTRTRCLNARRSAGVWQVELQDGNGRRFTVCAKAMVNAAGPWVATLLRDDFKQTSPYGIRLIQGSHLIVPKLYEGDNAFILQNEDKRIVFTIPYLDQFTLVGTTDQEYQGDRANVKITEHERDYILKVANDHFNRQLTPGDILHTYSGVRPLCNDESDNPSAITRDYTLALNGERDEAPIVSVFGGKLTTYRKLAESVMDLLVVQFPTMKPAWTASAPLPGGEGPIAAHELMDRCAGLTAEVAHRWARTYGTRSWHLLGDARGLADLGMHFGAGLYAREVEYLCEQEWAVHAHDILWRRTKLGLFTTQAQQLALQAWLEDRDTGLIANGAQHAHA